MAENKVVKRWVLDIKTGFQEVEGIIVFFTEQQRQDDEPYFVTLDGVLYDWYSWFDSQQQAHGYYTGKCDALRDEIQAKVQELNTLQAALAKWPSLPEPDDEEDNPNDDEPY